MTRALPTVALILSLVCAAATIAAEPAEILVVLNKSDHTASLLDAVSGKELAVLPTGKGPHEVAVTSDGRTAVVADYGGRGAGGRSLTVLDLAARKVVRTIDLGKEARPHGILFMPDDRRVVITAEAARAVMVVDVEKGVVEKELPTEADISHMLALSRDAKRAFVANIGSGSMTAVDLTGKEGPRQVETGGGAEGITVSPDGKEVWVSNRAVDTVTVIDTKTLEKKAEVDAASFPIRAAFTPDGKHVLVSCARSGDLAVIDAASRKTVARIAMKDASVEDKEGRLFGSSLGGGPVPIGVVTSPDGKRAYVANTNADTVTVIDLEKRAITGRFTAGHEPDGMAYAVVR